MTLPATMVAINGLSRRYDRVVAVDGVSFTVARGEMFGLIGPDGAGKTTTLRIVLGLLAPDRGAVAACGLDPAKQRAQLAERVGYLSQRFSLYGDLSVDENVAFFAQLRGVRKWKPLRDRLLSQLQLSPFRKRLADRLSGGMKQKLALACTLIHTPELLILDEPTTGVDPVSRRDFWKILAHLQRDGLTVLMTTPYLDEAERCQRVALMNRGRLLLVGAPDALRGAAGLLVIELLAAPRAQATRLLQGRDDVESVQSFGERLHVTVAEHAASNPPAATERLVSALAAGGCTVQAARPVRPSLEDIFIAEIRAGDVDSPAQSEVAS